MEYLKICADKAKNIEKYFRDNANNPNFSYELKQNPKEISNRINDFAVIFIKKRDDVLAQLENLEKQLKKYEKLKHLGKETEHLAEKVKHTLKRKGQKVIDEIKKLNLNKTPSEIQKQITDRLMHIIEAIEEFYKKCEKYYKTAEEIQKKIAI